MFGYYTAIYSPRVLFTKCTIYKELSNNWLNICLLNLGTLYIFLNFSPGKRKKEKTKPRRLRIEEYCFV